MTCEDVFGGHMSEKQTPNPPNRPNQLEDMQKRVKEVNVTNGWFDSDRSFGDDIALLHSEVSEAFEAYRSWSTEDVTVAQCKNRTSNGWHDQEAHLCKPEGVGSELADILVRLLDTCERYDIDLTAEFERKLAYNATRGHRHGGKIV